MPTLAVLQLYLSVTDTCWVRVYSVECHFQLYRGGQFYWWRKLEYLEKTTNLVASHWQTLSHNVVSGTPRLSGIQTHNVTW